MNFSPRRMSALPIFKKMKILKLSDNIIALQNFMYAHDCINGNLTNSLCGKLSFVGTVRNTRSKSFFQLDKIRTRTITYGSNSIQSKSIDVWNFINELNHREKLHEKSRMVSKEFVKEFLIDRY